MWVDLSPVIGREQSGRRPAVVVSSVHHLNAATTLATVLPCTSRDRSWPNHVRLTGPIGMTQPTFAMTEQCRTVSRSRITGPLGNTDPDCLSEILTWTHLWIAPSTAGDDLEP